MLIYSIYTLLFLFLYFGRKGMTKSFQVTEGDTKYILLGLVLYSLCNVVSHALIHFDLKSQSYQIVNPHFVLLAICFFLFYKMITPRDSSS